MRDQGEFERWLAQVPVPSLQEGPHREQVKAQLLHPTHPSQGNGEEPMRTRTAFRTTRLLKLAAGLLIAAVVVAAGWTAEKVYESVSKKSRVVEVGDGYHTVIPPDAPADSAEKAKRHHEEMKQLIGQKKYKFVNTFEMPRGRKHYVYQFTFADGSKGGCGFSIPLEKVTSWDDYLQKSNKEQAQLNEKMRKAIVAGKFRAINVEPLLTHVCREVDSGQKVRVQRIALPDGKQIASFRREEAHSPEYETSWEEHLEEVRQGKRVLLDEQTFKNYTYELTLEDGSTTGFTCGGAQPLEKTPPEEIARMFDQAAGGAAGKDR